MHVLPHPVSIDSALMLRGTSLADIKMLKCSVDQEIPCSLGLGGRLAAIDQSQLRQRQRELHTSHEQSLTRLPLELLNGLARSPRTSSAFQSTCPRVLDTTYFFAALIVWAKGSIQSGLAPVGAGGRHADSIIS